MRHIQTERGSPEIRLQGGVCKDLLCEALPRRGRKSLQKLLAGVRGVATLPPVGGERKAPSR